MPFSGRQQGFATHVRRVGLLAIAVPFVLGACASLRGAFISFQSLASVTHGHGTQCEEQRHEKPRVGVWDGLVLVGGALAKPLPGVDLDWFMRLLVGNVYCSVRYLYGFAWE